jgi:rod shape determining protein RodA
LAALWVLSRVPPQQLRRWTPWLFLFSLVVLLLVPFFGTGRSGRHWLNLGFFYLQPAELMKLSVPMAVAALLHREPLPPEWRSLFFCLLLIGLPVGLIMLQPDFGTAVVVAASGTLVVWMAGLSWPRIGLLAALGLSVLPLGWQVASQYQRQRILTFLDPDADPLGTGWNIIQSKVAAGSGGLFGKGWGNSTQARLDFLPEQTTDFIFAVYAEEFGLFGTLILIGVFMALLWRIYRLAIRAYNAERFFESYVAIGLGTWLGLQTFINLGVNMGLLPTKGLTLPLISYGRSSLIVTMIAIALLLRIHHELAVDTKPANRKSATGTPAKETTRRAARA